MVDLISGLLKKGHHVSVIGTADSRLPGTEVIGVVPQGLNFLPPPENDFYQHTSYLTLMMAEMIKRQGEFDLVHNHMYPEYLPLLGLPALKTPMVTTVHSQMIPLTIDVLKAFPKAHLVAISHMAKKASGIDSMTVVHNSVDVDLFHPDDSSKDYLLAVGRMSKAKDDKGNFLDPKGITTSIKIAQMTGERLIIVGNVEDPLFYEMLVKPHLSEKIEFVGQVSAEQTMTREEMATLFREAKAFINPINWQEPFGLVMAEALASGTPVVAYDRGAVREIVKEGEVGYIVDPQKGIEDFSDAVTRIGKIDRRKCREYAVAHFSTSRMVDEYENIYKDLVRHGRS